MSGALDRRRFLGVGAGAAAGVLLPAGVAEAAKRTPTKHGKKPKPKPSSPPACTVTPQPLPTIPGGRIDLHAHLVPTFYAAALVEAGQLTIGGYPIPVWTPEEAIGFMDNYGIATQVLSVSDPGVSFLTGNAAASLARQVNEYTAQVIKQYPGRFGGFAVLPMPDVVASLNELEHALDTLGLDGVGLLSSYGGINTADPQFELLWAELNRRGTFVFMHPTTLPSNMKPPTTLPDFIVEFTFETTRFVAAALNLGLLKTLPNVRIQLAHAGGCYPFLAYRVAVIQHGVDNFFQATSSPLDGAFPTSATKGLYYDTAISPAPSSMRSVLEITDIDHIVFGSDWPFTQLLFLTSGDPQPQLSLTFAPAQRAAVERANALAQLPTLAARLGVAA